MNKKLSIFLVVCVMAVLGLSSCSRGIARRLNGTTPAQNNPAPTATTVATGASAPAKQPAAVESTPTQPAATEPTATTNLPALSPTPASDPELDKIVDDLANELDGVTKELNSIDTLDSVK